LFLPKLDKFRNEKGLQQKKNTAVGVTKYDTHDEIEAFGGITQKNQLSDSTIEPS
jgi:hypothetical protein